ncbi:MAG: recB, partial [Nocardioidaceae bacterium]|nr:recB [Nocardioidaceae bacterium]
VTRYVAEDRARLDEMLVVTFGRAASQELRERVREQLVEAERALADPEAALAAGGLLAHLASSDVPARRRRLADAVASFDAATIATTHQFCHLVLRSLGVAGDTDGRADLVEDLDDLVVEVTDDLYLLRFGDSADKPPFDRGAALALARAAVNDPQAALAPTDPEPGTVVAARVDFARAVRDEVDRRKQRRGVLSYDDLLSRLAESLVAADAPARTRMRDRWKVVLVDEFQDTDPVQWQVLDRAFSGVATLVLIGDPKQAIYAFRGGDVVTYLDAAGTAGARRTLATNHRSDKPLVDALQVLTRGAALGDERITVHPVDAERTTSRFAGLPVPDPFRLRVVRDPSRETGRTIPADRLRKTIAADLAADVARLLASGATYDAPDGPRPVRAGDVAILMFSLSQVDVFREALHKHRIPSVVTSGGSVLLSQAGAEWLTLLEALERQRAHRVRALALTSFVGETPESLDSGGDALTDRVAERARGWLDLFRTRGVAAVHEAAHAAGLPGRVLAQPDGERLLTDLDHLGQVLHDVARREQLGLPALLEWLRAERRSAVASTERTRRLDTDAAAVQIVTVHGSKGLQYPVVYLPWLFDRWLPDNQTVHRFHEGDRRMLDVGHGKDSPFARPAREEDAGEELRLTYVALTRAQSQVVAWFAPSWNAGSSGLTRLLFGRGQGEAVVPDTVSKGPSDAEIDTVLGRWEQAGALRVEPVAPAAAPALAAPTSVGSLGVRTFDRGIDTAWRRTSYSGLIRAEEQTGAAVTEPEVEGTVDEEQPPDDADERAAAVEPMPDDLVSPMNDLPAGATFGSLVHGVLEHADPDATDLVAELRTHVVEQQRWWSVEATSDDLAAALLPMQHTSLGPLADDLTLARIPLSDRLRELDFEFPLVGGDRTDVGLPDVPVRAIADVLRTHLPADDPMRAYADKLESPALGDQLLRGYLSGSIDVVLRVGGRYVVVDYKTNRLGEPDRALTARDYTQPLMTEAMLHSHYPLQALLYSVVLHRYLRWRLPGYDPETHLGGILYLYVRGMCGPQTPVVDGQPCGVFAWQPPAALVTALSDLLAGVSA